MTNPWLIREYRDEDLEAIIRLCESTPQHQSSVFSLAECIGALRSRQPAVVAIHKGRTIGVAVSVVSGDRAWIVRIALTEEWRGQGLVSTLLRALEARLVERRVHRISYVLRQEELLATGLEKAGYRRSQTVGYFVKTVSVDSDQAAILERLGGQILPDGLWDALAGMEREKQLLERRVVLPLAQPERAQQHGVQPPRAIALFGPPGTGKTTFARAIASRMGWPFVELFPSRLACDQAGLPAALRELFGQLAQLERVVVFLDEVEEIATNRFDSHTTATPAVTNELLKLIPVFRQHDTRLLVCATNTISSLDPAFLRPGRFDYIIPIGTPDASARRAIWRRFAGDSIDVERLVTHSEGLTPAEIEFAAQSSAQASFERDLSSPTPDPDARPITADYMKVLAKLKASVDTTTLDIFQNEIEQFARL